MPETCAFCERSVMPKSPPVPVCGWHASKIVEFVDEYHPAVALVGRERAREATRKHVERRDAERRERLSAQTQVYYVRIGDHIKIGYTQNVRVRMTGLRVSIDAVLATEPGGPELERERHEQFQAERVGRREDFNPSDRLLAHIEDIRAKHGPPTITRYLALR